MATRANATRIEDFKDCNWNTGLFCFVGVKAFVGVNQDAGFHLWQLKKRIVQDCDNQNRGFHP